MLCCYATQCPRLGDGSALYLTMLQIARLRLKSWACKSVVVVCAVCNLFLFIVFFKAVQWSMITNGFYFTWSLVERYQIFRFNYLESIASFLKQSLIFELISYYWTFTMTLMDVSAEHYYFNLDLCLLY